MSPLRTRVPVHSGGSAKDQRPPVGGQTAVGGVGDAEPVRTRRLPHHSFRGKHAGDRQGCGLGFGFSMGRFSGCGSARASS